MQTQSPHRIVNPNDLAPAVGFAHAVTAAPGRHIFLGGQTAAGPDGSIIEEDLPEQVDHALANLATALEAAGASPVHLTTMTVYTTRAEQYRRNLAEIGRIYQRHLGKHYPAMAFFEVAGLFDPKAVVEFVAAAVVPA